jgi:hypothetical protein
MPEGNPVSCRYPATEMIEGCNVKPRYLIFFIERFKKSTSPKIIDSIWRIGNLGIKSVSI